MFLREVSKIRWWLALRLAMMVLILSGFGVLVLRGVAEADVNPGTNIDPTVRTDAHPYDSTEATSTFWGWNEVIGWIDFHNTHKVMVGNRDLKGYASSSMGEISLNCETSPLGNICDTSDYKVENDGGSLRGWAWNDFIGWISFCGRQSTSTCPDAGYSFQTRIVAVIPDQPPSDFTDYAWSDAVGWISFNCDSTGHSGGCDSSDYRVRTSWFVTSTVGYLDSSTFDTEVQGGVNYNSIFWRGAMPAGTGVSFQLASSNCADGETNPPSCTAPPPEGVWSDEQFLGPSGTSNDSFDFNSGSFLDQEYGQYYFISLEGANPHANKRYFRYRIWLFSNSNSTLSPKVDEVIINWSP